MWAITPPFLDRIDFYCTFEHQEIDTLHRTVVMRVDFLYCLSYDTVSLPYVDLYTFTRVWLRPRLLITQSAL